MALKSQVNISVGSRDGHSYLKSAYYTPPFKIANITEQSSDSLQLMLMNASPGILDGDVYHLNIEIEESASLQLQTQSYQRLFQMQKSAAQNMSVRLANQSCFYFLPHPVVPHKNSSFTSKNQFFLTSSSFLIFGEVLTCGRRINGELFEFSRYHNKTEIFLNDRLVVKENLLLQPIINSVYGVGLMEGYTHQASLLILNPAGNVDACSTIAEEILGKEQQICYGVSELPVKGCIVRILGYKSEQLFQCLNAIGQQIQHINQRKELRTVDPVPIYAI